MISTSSLTRNPYVKPRVSRLVDPSVHHAPRDLDICNDTEVKHYLRWLYSWYCKLSHASTSWTSDTPVFRGLQMHPPIFGTILDPSVLCLRRFPDLHFSKSEECSSTTRKPRISWQAPQSDFIIRKFIEFNAAGFWVRAQNTWVWDIQRLFFRPAVAGRPCAVVGNREARDGHVQVAKLSDAHWD